MKSKNTYILMVVAIIAIVAVVLIIMSTQKKSNEYTYEGDPSSVRSLASYDAEDLIIQKAMVSEISVMMLESFPVQVRVTAKGDLRNGCEEIYEILSEKNGKAFTVTMNAAAPKDEVCTQVLRPFEETFALDVAGLAAGTYTVDVNGITGTFTLAVDNGLDFESSRDK